MTACSKERWRNFLSVGQVVQLLLSLKCGAYLISMSRKSSEHHWHNFMVFQLRDITCVIPENLRSILFVQVVWEVLEHHYPSSRLINSGIAFVSVRAAYRPSGVDSEWVPDLWGPNGAPTAAWQIFLQRGHALSWILNGRDLLISPSNLI